jgi:adenylosuccinate lyase
MSNQGYNMEPTHLTALSPLDGRYQEKVKPLQAIFSEYALMRYRVIVEVRWLEKIVTTGTFTALPALTDRARTLLNQLIDTFSIESVHRIKKIEATTRHDIKAVEYFIKAYLAEHPELAPYQECVHFGCTSEDINNLAHGLMLKDAREQCLKPSLQQLIAWLQEKAKQYASLPMLSRTHGQPATPTTLGKEFANVFSRLSRQLTQFEGVPILGKMNGASGNYNALAITNPKVNWQTVSQAFVTSLELTWNPYTTQIEPHDAIAEYFAVIARINTILIDFNRDIWAYIAIRYFNQKPVECEVGSSAMPHKINPIDFENAEGNLGLSNALAQHFIEKLPISRWQRDLSDSTVLRNMGVALGHAYLAYQTTLQGLGKLEPDQEVIAADLNQHWEILAEPIQTLMRAQQLHQPYEQLKALTRGKTIDQEALRQFISTLSLSKEAKAVLLSLTPAQYMGYAEELAKTIKR